MSAADREQEGGLMEKSMDIEHELRNWASHLRGGAGADRATVDLCERAAAEIARLTQLLARTGIAPLPRN